MSVSLCDVFADNNINVYYYIRTMKDENVIRLYDEVATGLSQPSERTDTEIIMRELIETAITVLARRELPKNNGNVFMQHYVNLIARHTRGDMTEEYLGKNLGGMLGSLIGEGLKGMKLQTQLNLIDFYLTRIQEGYLPSISEEYPLQVGVIERRFPSFEPRPTGVAVIRRLAPGACPVLDAREDMLKQIRVEYPDSVSIPVDANPHKCDEIWYGAAAFDDEVYEIFMREVEDSHCDSYAATITLEGGKDLEKKIGRLVTRNDAGPDAPPEDLMNYSFDLVRVLYSAEERVRQ